MTASSGAPRARRAPPRSSARRLADDLGLHARRVLEPGDERARVEERPAGRLPPPVLVQADEARASRRAPHRRGSASRRRRPRAVSSLSSAPPRRTTSASRSTSSTRAARSSRTAAMVSASTRLPCEEPAAATGVVVSSSSSSSTPSPRSSPASCARPRRVVGDEAEPVPVGPESPHRLGPAGHGLARHVQDAVDVEQNRRHAPRVYSRAPRACDPAGRDPASDFALERAGRPACPEDRVASRGALRRRRLGDALGRAEGPARTRRRPGGPGRRAGRAEPVPEPRARTRASRRALRAALRTRPRRRDEADDGGEGAASRRERLRSRTKRLRRPPDDDYPLSPSRPSTIAHAAAPTDVARAPGCVRTGLGRHRTRSPTTSWRSSRPGAMPRRTAPRRQLPLLPTDLPALCLTLALALAGAPALGKRWAGWSRCSIWLFGVVPVLGFALDTLIELPANDPSLSGTGSSPRAGAGGPASASSSRSRSRSSRSGSRAGSSGSSRARVGALRASRAAANRRPGGSRGCGTPAPPALRLAGSARSRAPPATLSPSFRSDPRREAPPSCPPPARPIAPAGVCPAPERGSPPSPYGIRDPARSPSDRVGKPRARPAPSLPPDTSTTAPAHAYPSTATDSVVRQAR